MSLLSTDITKVKRLSLREVKLPTPERMVQPFTPTLVEKPPTDEEIAYCNFVAINPLLAELVERLDLVSIKTGERIKKVELREEIQHIPHLKKEIDKPKLIALAQKVLEKEVSYSMEELIARIIQATNVTKERAEVGFNLMLQAGAIETTPGESYYLTGSTPF